MMPTYSNGYIPDHLLVTFAEGANTVDGSWKHQLSPGTYAKHLALVKRSPGGRLQVSPGWGAYRPYYAQVIARRIYGNGAAVPGTSSHGGFWEGRQTLAIDYHNWGSVYGWDQARWFADCRAVGLTPGMIMRSRGYPDEPWHVIDLDPWAPAPASNGATPFETDPEDDMFTDEDRNRLNAAYGALYGPRNLDGSPAELSWLVAPGTAQTARYGVLPIVIHNQALIAKQAGRIAAVEQVVEQLAVSHGAVLDMAAVEAAAERGAERALEGLSFTVSAESPEAS